MVQHKQNNFTGIISDVQAHVGGIYGYMILQPYGVRVAVSTNWGILQDGCSYNEHTAILGLH